MQWGFLPKNWKCTFTLCIPWSATPDFSIFCINLYIFETNLPVASWRVVEVEPSLVEVQVQQLEHVREQVLEEHELLEQVQVLELLQVQVLE